uniref:Uncharacterized protein n=1 Tax=Glossina palpalis gambiensis TaxID=67801 RepID=A0A1B0BIK1_9MUSC
MFDISKTGLKSMSFLVRYLQQFQGFITTSIMFLISLQACRETLLLVTNFAIIIYHSVGLSAIPDSQKASQAGSQPTSQPTN